MTTRATAPICHACGFANPAGMRFCGGCGAPLPPAPASPPRPRHRARSRGGTPGSGERRPLTVLFCDLVDFTRLTATLDPEDLRRVILEFRELCGVAIEGGGGTLAQFLGDGVLAYFGFPRAREDDAQHAVRAGLALQAAMRGLNARLAAEGLPSPLAARVGIHTGLAVVADLGAGTHGEPAAAVGETTSIAARLQQAAAPGQVLVSEATRRLVEGRFRLADAGPQALKGVPRPIGAALVLEELPQGALLLPTTHNGATGPPRPLLLGRDAELRSLMAAWRDVEAGAGAVLAIEGEPGLGKSRLVQEFLARVHPGGCQTAVLACAADDRTTAWHPVLAWLRRRLGGQSGPALRRALLARAAEAALAAEHLAPLAALLDCATAEEERELAAAPRRRRRRTLEALLALLLDEGTPERPLALVAEDVHWADDSTLALLRLLADRCTAGAARAFLLLTQRPNGRSLPGRSPLTLRLGRLEADEARRLAETVAPPGLPETVLARILARTDGVPLFIEEVARTAAPAATGAGLEAEIPLTLRGSLVAQLDALEEAKPVAQLAAVLGRSFQVTLIEAVAGEGRGPALRRALRRLVEARFLEPEGAGEQPEGFAFRHALIRDAAYESLLRHERRRLHLRTASVLRERFPETAETRPELLAQHLAAGGRDAEAAAAYEAAAQRAAVRSAHEEAAEHCRAALGLTARLPSSRERDEAEVRLQAALAAQLTIARGNAEPEVLQAFERGHEAALRLGDRRLIIRTLRGQQTFHLVRGNIAAGHAISERVMRLALGAEEDPGVLLQAWRAHGLSLLYLARFAEAREALRRTLALYDPARHATQRFEYGSDAAVLAHAHLGWVEWHLGDAAAAETESGAALSAARRLDHPHSLAFALAFEACLQQFASRPKAVLAAAEELSRLARAHDFAYWIAWAEILEGWATARLGDAAAGEDLLHRGIDDYSRTGAGLLLPYARHLMADVLRARRPSEALALLDLSLAEAEANAIRIFEPAAQALRAAVLAELAPPQGHTGRGVRPEGMTSPGDCTSGCNADEHRGRGSIDGQ